MLKMPTIKIHRLTISITCPLSLITHQKKSTLDSFADEVLCLHCCLSLYPLSLPLHLDKLLSKVTNIVEVEALDENVKVIGSVSFTQRNNKVTFQTQVGTFAYRLRLKHQ